MYVWQNNGKFGNCNASIIWCPPTSTSSNIVINVVNYCFVLCRYFRVAAGAVIFFLVSSWATTIMVSLHYGYRARIQDPFAMFDELYDKPWTRLGPYLVGMFAGWFLLRSKNKIKMSLVIEIILTFMGPT
uniref:Uncharacterized protein n=1 Tax=Cacopsylla melanoneura TaxID=428564 RepID=A0A8D8RXE1_9HEMI